MSIPLLIEITSNKTFRFGSKTKQSIGKTKITVRWWMYHVVRSRNCWDWLTAVSRVGHSGQTQTVRQQYRNYSGLCVTEMECLISRKHGHLFYERNHWTFILNENSSVYIDISIIHIQIKCSFWWKEWTIHMPIQRHSKKLETISQKCDICQRLANQGGRLRFFLPNEDFVFNITLLMDLMNLESKTALHVVCKHNAFSAVIFVQREFLLHVWNYYVRIWVNSCIGHP